jgi:hypothetical protein
VSHRIAGSQGAEVHRDRFGSRQRGRREARWGPAPGAQAPGLTEVRRGRKKRAMGRGQGRKDDETTTDSARAHPDRNSRYTRRYCNAGAGRGRRRSSDAGCKPASSNGGRRDLLLSTSTQTIAHAGLSGGMASYPAS